MIKPDLSHVADLEEFYTAIVAKQQQAHGDSYTLHHQILTQLAKECYSVKELGVCQGATLAALLLNKPNQLTGIDINDQYFSPYQNIFAQWASDNHVDFQFIKGSSVDKNLVSAVDLLHIDSYHTHDHLCKELALHAPAVKKYIVCHDTVHVKSAPGLLKAIVHYITEVEPQWRIIEHCIYGAGHTVIERVGNASK